MNLSQLSERISLILTKDMEYSDEKKEIVAYGIESVFLAIFGAAAIIFVAFLFNAVVSAVFAAIFGGFLRKLSGGAHFHTPLSCLLSGSIVYAILGVIAKEIIRFDLYHMNTMIMILLLSLILVSIFAPVDSEAKPIHSESFRKKLKVASIGFVTLAIIMVLLNNNPLINTSAALGIGFQTLTLLPVFNIKKKEGKS